MLWRSLEFILELTNVMLFSHVFSFSVFHSYCFLFINLSSAMSYLPSVPSSVLFHPLYNSFFKKRFYFLEGKGGRKKEGERNIDVWEKHWLVASRTPPTGDLDDNLGLCPDGIKPATFRFIGQCSIQWATPARAWVYFSHKTFQVCVCVCVCVCRLLPHNIEARDWRSEWSMNTNSAGGTAFHPVISSSS